MKLKSKHLCSDYLVLSMVLICFSTTAYFGCTQTSLGWKGIGTEEYEVYKVVIDSLCFRPVSLEEGLMRAESYLVVDSTLPFADIMRNYSLLPHASNFMPLFEYPNRDSFATQESWIKGLSKFDELVGTNPAGVFEYYKKHFPDEHWSYIKKQFDSLNQRQERLDSSRLIFSVPHYMVEPRYTRSFNDYASTGLPSLFRSSGFIGLSRVAFDPLNKKAVLCFRNGTDGDDTFGFVFLSKESGSWKFRSLMAKIFI